MIDFCGKRRRAKPKIQERRSHFFRRKKGFDNGEEEVQRTSREKEEGRLPSGLEERKKKGREQKEQVLGPRGEEGAAI